MGNCVGSNKVTNPQRFTESTLPPLPPSSDPVASSLKQFATAATDEAALRVAVPREKAVIIETSSELMGDDRQQSHSEQAISEHTFQLNPTHSILLDSLDFAEQLRCTVEKGAG
jgi:hypothetical protein